MRNFKITDGQIRWLISLFVILLILILIIIVSVTILKTRNKKYKHKILCEVRNPVKIYNY